MKDLKIINGKFPDFDSNSWVQADILIHGGKIEKIGNVSEECTQVIDAEGKVVSPGFIDIHAHEDKFAGGREDDFLLQEEACRWELRLKSSEIAAIVITRWKTLSAE